MNVGLIGCGRISGRHVAAIEANELLLFGIYDIDKSKMFPNTGHYSSYEQMLSDEHVDIVSICTPSNLHAEMAVKAAEAGKHVLVEKPLALNSTDAKAVIDACLHNGVTLCVVVQNRFNIPMLDIKSKIDSGDFGRVLVANTTVRWYRPPEYFEGTWQGSFGESGGVVLNQAAHHLDALLWLVGDVYSVSAHMEYFGGRSVPDACVAAMRFENGAIGTFEASTVTYPRNVESSVTAICERGTFKVGGCALNRFDIYHTDPQLFEVRELTEDVYGSGHIAQYAELVSAIKEERLPTTDGWAALAVVKFAEDIWRSDTNRAWT